MATLAHRYALAMCRPKALLSLSHEVRHLQKHVSPNWGLDLDCLFDPKSATNGAHHATSVGAILVHVHLLDAEWRGL